MKTLLIASCMVLLAGCASPSRSHYDKFEKVQVDRMIDNEVNFCVFSRSVVCLNALREASFPEPSTNYVVNFFTNAAITSLTNQTVTTSNNEQRASQTNLLAASQGRAQVAERESSLDTPVTPSLSPQDSGVDGQTISTSSSESIATAPNQSVSSRNVQKVLLVTGQALVNTGTNSLTVGTNQTITIETNTVVTTLTNYIVSPVTNVTVLSGDKPVHSYYLVTELSPADFTLQSGESLVLLVDGTRYSFAPTQPQTSIKPRPGFLTTYYKVPPQVIVGIANAHKVSMRIKGTSGLIESNLGNVARKSFRKFLTSRFGKEA